MKHYIVRFSLHSSILSPFQSDIIFGHLAWGWRYLNGEEALRELIDSLDASPVLISDAFPYGKLPKPILPPVPISRQNAQALESSRNNGKYSKAGMVKALTRFKEMKSITYISAESLATLRSNLSCTTIINNLADEKEEMKIPMMEEVVGHNTINRATGMVAKAGGFHPQIETFYPNGCEFWCWIAGDYWNKEDLTALWEYIENSGFGADSSIGKGRIKVESIEEAELEIPEGANAVMSLSTFIPADNCPTVVDYDSLIKFGRLGSIYANRKDFYKSALLMLKPGSIIKTEWKPEVPLGKTVKNVHWDTGIVHYGHIFPYPVKIAEGEL